MKVQDTVCGQRRYFVCAPEVVLCGESHAVEAVCGLQL